MKTCSLFFFLPTPSPPLEKITIQFLEKDNFWAPFIHCMLVARSEEVKEGRKIL